MEVKSTVGRQCCFDEETYGQPDYGRAIRSLDGSSYMTPIIRDPNPAGGRSPQLSRQHVGLQGSAIAAGVGKLATGVCCADPTCSQKVQGPNRDSRPKSH